MLMRQLEGCARLSGRLGAALVSIDPQTGYIKAMVGGQDYSKSQYNIATNVTVR